MIRHHTRTGFTLIEVMTILIIAATVAALGIRHLATAGTTARQRSCDTSRELLQSYAQQYFEETGRYPTGDLKPLVSAKYAGDQLPTCPVSGADYVFKSGIVVCSDGRHDN